MYTLALLNVSDDGAVIEVDYAGYKRIVVDKTMFDIDGNIDVISFPQVLVHHKVTCATHVALLHDNDIVASSYIRFLYNYGLEIRRSIVPTFKSKALQVESKLWE